MSGYNPEQSHREHVEQALDSIDKRLAEQVGDARAQLWARVYAAEFSACRHALREFANDVFARNRARTIADAAVRDFDEHYLGGRR